MEERKTVDKKSIIAILLIVAGGLLFLQTFDLIDFSIQYYILNWKTLLIAIGIIVVASSDRKTAGYILIGLGFLFWVPSFAGYNIRLHQVFWPLVLIGIGLTILNRRNVHDRAKRIHGVSSSNGESISNDYIDDVSIFGGGTKKYTSQNVKGGNVTAIFGGSEIDLLNADLAVEGAVIDVFTMFGGTKLIIPGSWQVKSEVFSMFGGLSDKRHIKPTEALPDKTIIVKGVVLFGGVEIKNY
ncbi:MAG: cell wall-active antibiotics response protein [Chlorobi bacterium]|nr:cell wall-active antibiotics response protein [Chlorobiota bacterium]